MFSSLTQLADSILSLLTIQTFSPLTRGIALLLLGKLSVLCALITFSGLNRFYRLWSRRQDPKWRNFFGEIILACLNESPVNILEIVNRSKAVFVSKSNRGFFRRLLLERLSDADTVDRQKLLILYRTCGLLEDDLKDLRLRSWAKRLSAAVRLEQLQYPDLASEWSRLLADKNELVALVALRASSKIESQFDAILETLSRRAPARKDVFYEILLTIAKTKPEKVVAFIFESFDPEIAALCIRVLGELRYRPAVQTITGLLTSSSDIVVGASLRALGKIADPETLSNMRALLNHDSDLVRAQAVAALLDAGDKTLVANLLRLQTDPSINVRRIAFEALLGSKLVSPSS